MYTLLPVGGLGFLQEKLMTSLLCEKKILNTESGLPYPLPENGFLAKANRIHGNTLMSIKRPILPVTEDISLKL